MKFTAVLSFLALSSSATTAFQPVSSPLNRPQAASSCLFGTPDEFCVGILGDLHIDPRVMEDYETGRSQWVNILGEAKQNVGDDNVALVSLGDLGESKSVRPEETSELFAGTTECHELASDFLSGFGVPYDVVGGNHGKSSLSQDALETGSLKFCQQSSNDGRMKGCNFASDLHSFVCLKWQWQLS
jgi:hypothetical protein